jgi:DNA-binding transcriptional regulator YiaG
MSDEIRYTDALVRIPNLDGDGIAETLTVQIPVTIDPNTGEELLTERAIEIIDNAKARHMGLLLPPEIKKLRERVELTQKKISELVQSGEKSWTRWETGKARPSRMVNVLLRLIYEGKVFISDLVAQRNQGINWRAKVRFQPRLEPPILVSQIAAQFGAINYLGTALAIDAKPAITHPELVGLGFSFKKRDSPLPNPTSTELCLN